MPQSHQTRFGVSSFLLTAAGITLLLALLTGSYYLGVAQLSSNQSPNLTQATATPTAAPRGYIVASESGVEVTYSRVTGGTTTKILTVTLDPAHNTAPIAAISPDGNTLVYVDKDYSLQSYAIPTGKTTLLKAAVNDTAHVGNNFAATNVVFSPDGKKLGVMWTGWENRGVAIMNSDGSNYQQPTQGYGGNAIVFSPNSQQFAIAAPMDFMGGNDAFLYVANVATPDQGKNILPKEIKASTGDLSKNPYDLSWSPDGNQIALSYEYRDTGSADDTASHYREIYTLSVDGRSFQQVTHNESFSSNPQWLNNATLVYSESALYGGSGQGIYTVSTTGENNTRIFSSSTTDFQGVSLSPDGMSLAYVFGSPQGGASDTEDVGLLNIAGRTSQNLGAVTFIGWVK